MLILRNHQRGGVRICRIAEIIIDKAEDYKFPLRESKDTSERSLENTEINYAHMFDNKSEDSMPILKELDSTITLIIRLGPSLHKEQEKKLKFLWKNQYLPEAAVLAAPPEKYQKSHQQQLRPELQKSKRK